MENIESFKSRIASELVQAMQNRDKLIHEKNIQDARFRNLLRLSEKAIRHKRNQLLSGMEQPELDLFGAESKHKVVCDKSTKECLESCSHKNHHGPSQMSRGSASCEDGHYCKWVESYCVCKIVQTENSFCNEPENLTSDPVDVLA